MSDVITLQGVSKTYRLWHERNNSVKSFLVRRRSGRWDDLKVLDDVSFSIPRGVTFGLLGSNGAGKSTTLKLLSRIIVPDSGVIEVDGKVSALLELGAGFHPELSGRENIYMNGAILGLSRRLLRERFDAIVEFAGLEEFIDNQVKTYSSGMFARLGFAVAVNVDPDVLLLDEVLAVGDSMFQRKCHSKIAELRSTGRTVVLVSHDLATVRELCDQVAWIDRGQLVEVGPAGDVIDRYLAAVSPDATLDELGRTRIGSGRARVERVELLGPGGQSGLVAGEPFRLRFHLSEFPWPGNLILRMVFLASDGSRIAGSTTHRFVELDCPRDAPTVVDYSGRWLPLMPDTYQLRTALHERDSGEILDEVVQSVVEVHPGVDEGATAMVALGGSWIVS